MLLTLPWAIITFCVYDVSLEASGPPETWVMSFCFGLLNVGIFLAMYRFVWQRRN